MPKKRNYQCLLVKTKDNRKFFTHEKNFPQLIEFSRAFGAEVSVVKVVEAEVLDLSQLAPAICDGNYNQRPDFEIIETKIPAKKKRRRNNILKTSEKIREYIKEQFLSREVVSLKALTKKFRKYQMTSACFCNHMRVVREELKQAGHTIKKVGGGKYQLQ